MRAGWNGAEPPALPPLTGRERLRLACRAPSAALTLLVLFVLFLLLRGLDRLLERLAGRPLTALGPAIVQVWAAQALPTLGLRFVLRGTPMRGGGAFVANHASWIDIVALQRAAAPFLVSKAEVRSWPGIGFIGRAIGTMFIDRRPAEARRRRRRFSPASPAATRWRSSPRARAPTAGASCPSSRRSSASSSPPGSRARRPAGDDRLPPPARAAAGFYGWWGEMDFATHLRDVLARSTGGTVT